MLLIPRDSGVNALPLYPKRGHSHLPRVVGVVPRVVGVVPRVLGVAPRVNGLHSGCLLSPELERVLPIRLDGGKNLTLTNASALVCGLRALKALKKYAWLF